VPRPRTNVRSGNRSSAWAQGATFFPCSRKIVLTERSFSAYYQFEKAIAPVSEVFRAFADIPTKFEAAHLTPRELKMIKDIVSERIEFFCGDAHGLAKMSRAWSTILAGLGRRPVVCALVNTALVAGFGRQLCPPRRCLPKLANTNLLSLLNKQHCSTSKVPNNTAVESLGTWPLT
jgi:hypothetical protein